jgi:hypothetical protein
LQPTLAHSVRSTDWPTARERAVATRNGFCADPDPAGVVMTMATFCVAWQGKVAGRTTVSCVALAAVTETETPETVTVFSPGVVPKPEPVIVAVTPGASVSGEIAVTTGSLASTTVISVVAVFPSIVAVIVVVPNDTAVTLPLTTVATSPCDDVHVVVRPARVLPEPSFGVAVRASEPPIRIVAVCCDIETEETGAGFGVVEPSPPPPQATTTRAAAKAARHFGIDSSTNVCPTVPPDLGTVNGLTLRLPGSAEGGSDHRADKGIRQSGAAENAEVRGDVSDVQHERSLPVHDGEKVRDA